MMFACEGQRQKKYLKLRKEEEINQINQQEVLDELIAEEKGLDISAEKLSNLAKRVVNKIGEEVLQPEINKSGVVTPKPTDRILEAIRSGKLSELFEKIKGIPASKLTKKQKIIQKDLKDNTELKQVLNEEMTKIIAKNIPEEEKALEVKRAVNEYVSGDSDSDELESMASKSDSGSETSSQAPTVASTWSEISAQDSGLTGKAKTLYFVKKLNKNLEPGAAYSFTRTEQNIVKAAPELKDALKSFDWNKAGNKRTQLHKHLVSYVNQAEA